MNLIKSDYLMMGLIVMIGFGIGLHLDLYDKGDMYRIQNILSQAVVKSQSSMIQSAFMSDDANGLISHATVGFGLGSLLIDPDGPAENQQEYIENKVTECIFHSDEDIDLPICIVCKLVNEKLEPCEDIFLDFVTFPDGTTQDELNLGLASSGITITGKANMGFTGADDLFVWDVDVDHSSAQGPGQDDNDIESPGTPGGYCDGCDGWHILIFPDNDGTGNPDPMDDSESGGTITMTFDIPVYFAKFDIADIENDDDAKAIAYSGSLSATQCDPTTEIKTVPIPKVADDGDVGTVIVDANNVSCIEIIWDDSGGPTNFDFRCIKQLDPDTVIAKGEIILPDGYEGSDTLTFEFDEPADIFETMGVRVKISPSFIDFEGNPTCDADTRAKFILIDEDSIDNDDEPFTNQGCGQYLDETMFTSTPGCGEFDNSDPISPLDDNTAYPVNDDLANPGVRNELRFFDANPGEIIELQVGHITDEGWYAPQIIPQSWVDTGPTDDGIRNFVGVMQMPGGPLVPGDGLGVGGDPEALLDNIPDVRPIRYEGVLGLLGMDLCAVVYDSDISINFLNPNPPGGVEDGNLQGANLGIVAFRVLQVLPFGDDSPFTQGQDPQEIAKVKIGILDAKNDEGTGVCQGNLMTYVAPFIVDEDDPFDSGFNDSPTPAVALPFP